jgi:hypothetical protein
MKEGRDRKFLFHSLILVNYCRGIDEWLTMSGAVSPSFPPAPAPDQGSVCSGLVSHIEGELFWLQRDTDRVEEVGVMLEDVEVMKSAKDVKQGAAVVASWDGSWYRGVVREVRPDGLLQVDFIDYGNSDQLKLAAVRPAVGAELGDPALALRWSGQLGGNGLGNRECHCLLLATM